MLILASQSPRRAELLKQLQVSFTPCMVDIDESIFADEQPESYVQRLAEQKARAGQQISPKGAVVLGSDTIVVVDQQVLGKPFDQQDSSRMLRLLSNRVHQVYTAVAVVNEHRIVSCLVKTQVEFKALSDAEITGYWNTGEPADKAGSYGIQGLGGRFVKRIEGSYSAVVGLPLFETSELLSEMGIGIYER